MEINDEMLRYIESMMEKINTEDEKWNEENMEMLVKELKGRLKDQGIKANEE